MVLRGVLGEVGCAAGLRVRGCCGGGSAAARGAGGGGCAELAAGAGWGGRSVAADAAGVDTASAAGAGLALGVGSEGGAAGVALGLGSRTVGMCGVSGRTSAIRAALNGAGGIGGEEDGNGEEGVEVFRCPGVEGEEAGSGSLKLMGSSSGCGAGPVRIAVSWACAKRRMRDAARRVISA